MSYNCEYFRVSFDTAFGRAVVIVLLLFLTVSYYCAHCLAALGAVPTRLLSPPFPRTIRNSWINISSFL